MSKFSLGADPELFMKDATGAFISAVGLIGGSKEEPQPLPIGPGFMVQEDNVTVEYNIPPASTVQEFDNNIGTIMQFLSSKIADMGLVFSNESAVSFPPEQLLDPKAREFGCDPDFNAWKDGAMNPRPKAADKALRTCGGHIHVGYKFQSAEEVIQFMKHMDLFISVPAVLMDKGELRKELYGKAGAFRFKPYGGEYRSASNFWVFTKELRQWVWNSTELALDAWQNKKIDIDSLRGNILRAINKNNKDEAANLINSYGLLVV